MTRSDIIGFQAIHEAALIRHGSRALEGRLAVPRSAEELSALPEDRFLSAMSLRIFRAGLKHSVVDAKWPVFEDVLEGFVVDRCATLADERLEELMADKRLIGHLPKLRSIRTNARAMVGLRATSGGIGPWLAAWPGSDIMRLWDDMAKRFAQLGGSSAPSFLRMVGKDTFILTPSVEKALTYWQVAAGAGKAERPKIQNAFNQWAKEANRPLCQLSQILAMSVDD